jgi:hypothetical protein
MFQMVDLTTYRQMFQLLLSSTERLLHTLTNVLLMQVKYSRFKEDDDYRDNYHPHVYTLITQYLSL